MISLKNEVVSLLRHVTGAISNPTEEQIVNLDTVENKIPEPPPPPVEPEVKISSKKNKNSENGTFSKEI